MIPRDKLQQLPNFHAFDALFRAARDRYFGDVPWPWTRAKAQAIQESGLDPAAVSPAGAQGLMQLMPATDRWIDDDVDAFDPAGNIEDGVALMAWLMGVSVSVPRATGGVKSLGYCRLFVEVPWEERWRFALAAYNAGQGNVAKARGLCREAGGRFLLWADVSLYLARVTGAANSAQTLTYVRNVVAYADMLTALEVQG